MLTLDLTRSLKKEGCLKEHPSSIHHTIPTIMCPSSITVGNPGETSKCIPLMLPEHVHSVVNKCFRLGKTRHRAFVLIDYMMYRAILRKRFYGAPVSLHSKILRSLFGGGGYKRIINKLVDHEIISVGRSYQTEVQSKYYTLECLNPSSRIQRVFLYTTDYCITTFLQKNLRKDDMKTIEMMRSCIIDTQDVSARIERRLKDSQSLLNGVIIDESAPSLRRETRIEVWYFDQRIKRFRLYDKNLDTFLNKFRRDHWIWIRNKETLYYCPLQEYLGLKQVQVLVTSTKSVQNWQSGLLYAAIDGTSGRLHSNFTNLPGYLVSSIRYSDSKLRSIDYSCFQFLLLAKCIQGRIKNPIADFASDYQLKESTLWFCDLVEQGLLYEHIARSLKNERGYVKSEMMRCTFDSRTSSDKDDKFKAAVRGMFPQVIEMTDAYKNSFRNNKMLKGEGRSWYGELARELQRTETALIVGELHQKLIQQDVPHLTKHDSVHVPERYFAEAYDTILQFSESRLGNFHLKADLGPN